MTQAGRQVESPKKYLKEGWKMLNSIKVFISRIFCLHQWESDITGKRFLRGMPVYGKGIVKAYICKRCGKQVYSYIEPMSFYK